MKLILLGIAAALALSPGVYPSNDTQPAALDIGQNGTPIRPYRKIHINTDGRTRHIKPSNWNQRKARKRIRQVPELYKKRLKK